MLTRTLSLAALAVLVAAPAVAQGFVERPAYNERRQALLRGVEAVEEGNRRLEAVIAYQEELLDTLETDPGFIEDRAPRTDLCPDARLCLLFPWTFGQGSER